MSNEQAPECCPFCGAVKTNGVTLIGGGPRYECGTYAVYGPEKNVRDFQSPRCAHAERERLTRERDEVKKAAETAMVELGQVASSWRDLLTRVKRLEEAGKFLDDVADAADDDIREHLQVANYNLHGLLNTGERIQPPNPPQTIHQAGIDASVAVREDIRKARNEWRKAKEATP